MIEMAKVGIIAKTYKVRRVRIISFDRLCTTHTRRIITTIITLDFVLLKVNSIGTYNLLQQERQGMPIGGQYRVFHLGSMHEVRDIGHVR